MPEEEQATVEASDEESAAESAEAEGPKNIVTIEEAGPCKKKVIIEVPEEAIKNATDEQYETLRKEALVPGFRKGRTPRRLLEKRFGKEAMEQVKLKLLAEASKSAIKDNELAALGEPDIDVEKIELPDTGSLKFDFEVEVRPEFDLPPLEGIPVSKTKLEVTDEQINGEIERLQRWSGIWTPREKGVVELDDQIIADVVLKPVPSAVEGPVSPQDASQQNAVEKTEDVEERQKFDNIEIYVRQSGFVGAIPVEKLDELLVGTKAGDVKQTTVDVPKTYFREEYRGKKIDIQITIKDIKWLKPAALDENFLKRFQVEDENELREKIHDTLQSRLEQQGRTEMTEQIYEYLLDSTNFDLPLDIVAAHSTTLLQRQYVNLLARGLPREQIEEQMEQLRASSEQQAKEQLKTFFIMDKVADKLEIDVTEEEINGRIAQLAIQRGQRPERMREEMARNGSLAQFSLQVRENKCIAKLLESANVTEKKTEKKTAKRTPAKREPKSAKKQKDKTKK